MSQRGSLRNAGSARPRKRWVLCLGCAWAAAAAALGRACRLSCQSRALTLTDRLWQTDPPHRLPSFDAPSLGPRSISESLFDNKGKVRGGGRGTGGLSGAFRTEIQQTGQARGRDAEGGEGRVFAPTASTALAVRLARPSACAS